MWSGMKSGLWSSVICSAAAFMLAPQAFAGQPITLQSNGTSLFTLNAQPETVVIGNPAIADITLNGKQIFLHGHAFGDTNLIILDAGGNTIADFDITVGNNHPNMVVVFKGGPKDKSGTAFGRFSYTCAPYCETTMQPGDPWNWTDDLITENMKLNAFATGKFSAEANAPVAPQ
jgi:hypothetical protein